MFYIKHLFSLDDNYEWWSTFIENIQSKQLPVMEWMMKKLPRQQNKDREGALILSYKHYRRI